MTEVLPSDAPGEPVPAPKDTAAALLLFAGFLLLYLLTLCPTVYLGDSGEITLAIALGGIVHPPGYPLFTLLGRLAMVFVPVGEPAFRVGCVTAAAAAGSVALFFHLMREVGVARSAALLVAAALGVSYTFWNQSTRVEVYSVHVLLLLGAFIGAVRYRRTGHLRDLAIAALSVSLGLAHHLTIVLMGPALLIICGARLWKDPGLVRRLAMVLPLLVIGPSLYLLLVATAEADPIHAWGRPTDLPLLWNHVSARIYRSALQFPEGAWYSARAHQTLSIFRDNLGMVGIPLAIGGLVMLMRREAHLAVALLVAVSAVLIHAASYRIADIAPYYLPALVLLLVSTAVALQRLSESAGRLSGLVLAAFGFLFVLLPLGRNWASCDLSRAVWMREFARHKLESCLPNSVLLTHEDPDSFPVWYVRHVLGVRPDVTPVDYGIARNQVRRYHLDPSQWYLQTIRKQGIPLPLDYPKDAASRRRLDEEAWIFQELFRLAGERPICTTFLLPPNKNHPLFQWLRGRYTGVPQGICLELHPVHEPLDQAALLRRNQELWKGFTLPDIGATRLDQDMYPAYIISHYACMLVNYGGLYERAGHRAQAELVYRQAAELAPSYQPAHQALASLQNQEKKAGEPDEAG